MVLLCSSTFFEPKLHYVYCTCKTGGKNGKHDKYCNLYGKK